MSNLFVVQTYEGQSDIHGKWLRAQPGTLDFGLGFGLTSIFTALILGRAITGKQAFV